jgi:hypothetical protein
LQISQKEYFEEHIIQIPKLTLAKEFIGQFAAMTQDFLLSKK